MRSKLLTLIFALTVLSCEKKSSNRSGDMKVAETVIAFGSCNKTSIDQKIWSAVAKNNPSLFIWLGDIVYADTHDMDLMQQKYNELLASPGYQKIYNSVPVIGIWDDHDYGINDGGKNYAKRKESRQKLFNFLRVPHDDPIRDREGAYSGHDFSFGTQTMKILLLDGRYFRDTLKPAKESHRRYQLSMNGDILGEKQWAWLENELRTSKADLHIIGCGIQFIPEEHGYEKWANFPRSRKRLFSLLKEVKPANTILISGDRHMAEISKLELDGYSLFEFTSSGLTHTWSTDEEEPNRYRIGEKVTKRNFGIIKIKWLEKPLISFEIRGLENSLFKTYKIVH